MPCCRQRRLEAVVVDAVARLHLVDVLSMSSDLTSILRVANLLLEELVGDERLERLRLGELVRAALARRARYSSTSCTVMGSPSTVAMIRFTTSARPDPAARTVQTIATTASTLPAAAHGEGIGYHGTERRARSLHVPTTAAQPAWRDSARARAARRSSPSWSVAAGRTASADPLVSRSRPLLAADLLQQRLDRHRRGVVELEHDGVAAAARGDHPQVLQPAPQLHHPQQRVDQRRESARSGPPARRRSPRGPARRGCRRAACRPRAAG